MERFLKRNGLSHIWTRLNDQGMTLELLALASPEDLKDLTPVIGDRIRLRRALDQLLEMSDIRLEQVRSSDEEDSLVDSNCQTPQGSIGTLKKEESNWQTLEALSSNSLQVITVPDASSSIIQVDDQEAENGLAKFANENWEFVSEIGVLQERKPLEELLKASTHGKALFEKKRTSSILTPFDRKQLVQIIVEHELRQLPSVADTIRQDVWINWAQEICTAFPGEVADIYYVPYKVTERQVFPASGLLHNRLITHRRNLKNPEYKRKTSSRSSSAGSGASDNSAKRHRPLPQDCNICTSDPTAEQAMRWLEESCSPFELVQKKWCDTFKPRHDLLKTITVEKYFRQFPALSLPSGYKLLESDFEKAYPLQDTTFDENFPIIKRRLLELLIQKETTTKAESAITQLSELATVAEEQGSIAALRSIPFLLKQVAPVITKSKSKNARKDKWKPSRAEVAQSFIGFVTSASDVQRALDDRAKLALSKNVAFGPYIIAVGPSWQDINSYEVAISTTIRYHFEDIKSALKCAFKVYFALDIEYAGDAAPCWMLIQRTVFKITTKFDSLYDTSVTLRELINECLKLN